MGAESVEPRDRAEGNTDEHSTTRTPSRTRVLQGLRRVRGLGTGVQCRLDGPEDDIRPIVANWEEVAGDLIRHLHNQVMAAPSNHVSRG